MKGCMNCQSLRVLKDKFLPLFKAAKVEALSAWNVLRGKILLKGVSVSSYRKIRVSLLSRGNLGMLEGALNMMGQLQLSKKGVQGVQQLAIIPRLQLQAIVPQLHKHCSNIFKLHGCKICKTCIDL